MMEAWHGVLSGTLGCKHPNIDMFVRILQKEQSNTELKISKVNLGVPPEKSRLKWRKKNQRMLSIVQSYASHETKVQYLQKIANIIEFTVR